jgi:hypothetical protein
MVVAGEGVELEVLVQILQLKKTAGTVEREQPHLFLGLALLMLAAVAVERKGLPRHLALLGREVLAAGEMAGKA